MSSDISYEEVPLSGGVEDILVADGKSIVGLTFISSRNWLSRGRMSTTVHFGTNREPQQVVLATIEGNFWKHIVVNFSVNDDYVMITDIDSRYMDHSVEKDDTVKLNAGGYSLGSLVIIRRHTELAKRAEKPSNISWLDKIRLRD